MASSSTSFLGTIRGRLTAGTAALSLIPLILLALALGYYASRQAAASLNERAYAQMASIRAGKEEEIAAYFENKRNLIRTVANTAEVRQALIDMAAAQPLMASGVDLERARAALTTYYRDEFGKQYRTRNPGQNVDISDIVPKLPAQTVAAQYAYIVNNPNPLGGKGELNQADDGSAYSAAHARIHSYARVAVQDYGLYDFFLVDAQSGVVVYTYFKELDFATNLRDGPWAQTGLGQAFEKAASAKSGDEVFITDYATYRPSYDDQASFVSTPIVQDGRVIGVFVVQLPIDRINDIMMFGNKWKEVGLGESGEVYLVGQDKTPRSISRFMKQNSDSFITMMRGLNTPRARLAAMDSRDSNIGLMSIDTRGVRQALAGQSGTAVYPDYRGINVLGSYAPLDVLGLRWAIVSEIDEAESNAPVANLQRGILFAALGSLLVVGLVAVFAGQRLARSINVPLAQVQETVKKVGAGDLDARTGLKSNDEIGQLASAFDSLLDEKVAELARAQKENEQLNNSVIGIMTSVAQLAQRDLSVKVPVSEDVTGAVSDAINMMTGSTAKALGQIRSISSQVSQSSRRAQERASAVGLLANESGKQANAASTELGEAANALRQMGDQARDAGQQAERALTATTEAMSVVRTTVESIGSSRRQIEETEARMKSFSDISNKISTAVTLIEEIAERTSVIALTASMQAVAAGEAGRGFAVVADEVKRLAENAHAATGTITELVKTIKSESTETTNALKETVSHATRISRLAERAGAQMDETRTATQVLAQSVQTISLAAQAQAESSERLLDRAEKLINSSQRTLQEIELQQADTEELAGSAVSLVETISEFRLPEN